METGKSKFSTSACSVPVLLLAHARPETTVRVAQRVKDARPPKVYLAVDGPRASIRGEEKRVRAVRELLEDTIDWRCEVETLFREENKGIREGVFESISWFFDNEELGIILEDDCLPDPSFFDYCEDLLARYRNESRVMHVGGACLTEFPPQPQSYFFSRYALVWGWASWAERWKDMSLNPEQFEGFYERLDTVFTDRDEFRYWKRVLRDVLDGKIVSWDYFWAMTIWKNKGLAASASLPLVRNIGFQAFATNTSWWKDYRGFGDLELEHLECIEHPTSIELDEVRDRQLFVEAYRKPPLLVRIFKVARLFRRRVLKGAFSNRANQGRGEV